VPIHRQRSGPVRNSMRATGLFVDSSDNIYVADYYNFAIREIVIGGSITTVAGTLPTVINPFTNCSTYLTTGCGNGGPATSALLNNPNGVLLDASGDIFIADSEDFVVREVVSGNIQAFAGNGFEAYSGDGGLPTNAELDDPGAVFVDNSGNIFIADTDNSVIREVVAATGNIQTVAGDGVVGYSGDMALLPKRNSTLPRAFSSMLKGTSLLPTAAITSFAKYWLHLAT